MHAQPYSAPSLGVQIAERGGQWEASEIVHQENRGGNKGGGGVGCGEGERTPVNIVNKGSFGYIGFHYTLLLVDYDTFC